MEQVKIDVGGRELKIETGKLAKQADGSVTVSYGGTVVLVASVCARSARESAGFFPLTVEFQEKTFAAGKIPGGFFKREGRPSEKAILSARMIDRPIRPLFPDGMLNEVQVIASVLSSDAENDPDVLGLIGASAALTISDIPFDGPIGAVRVGMADGKFIVNPTFKEVEEGALDLVVVADAENVIMLEAGAEMVSEDEIMEAIKFGHEHLKPIIAAQKELQKKVGKAKRDDIVPVKLNEDLYRKTREKVRSKLVEIQKATEKHKRMEMREMLEEQLVKEAGEDAPETIGAEIKMVIEAIEKEILRDFVLNDKKRVDGRSFDEIRPLTSEVNILPRTHGSGLFTRGETQALAVTTLGTSSDEQFIDALEGDKHKSFMLHYNFPPFSVGEVRPMRGPGRREIGHGALAEKALKRVMPAGEDFPYTVRVVSEILESNGSSSMATVCASSLALMASGVPIKSAVSGIAMGLVTDGKTHVILTDIAGAEDHYGDMDFKVAGTKDGVTAVQMDIKIKGIKYEVLAEAFQHAKKARLKILEHMAGTIAEPMKELSETAPRIVTLSVPIAKIKDVIGPGGKMIRKIIAETGADINIEDDGTCQVASADKESLSKAVQMIKDLTAEPEIGRIYDATVVKIMAFGAFCQFMPGREGLVHVSELADKYVKNVEEVVKEGQEVKIKVIGIDDQGRVKLSIKQAQAKGEAQGEENKDKDKA